MWGKLSPGLSSGRTIIDSDGGVTSDHRVTIKTPSKTEECGAGRPAGGEQAEVREDELSFTQQLHHVRSLFFQDSDR